MSKIIATAAIRGAHAMVKRAEEDLAKAIEAKGKDAKVEYPNTAYYLPIMLLFLGQKVATLAENIFIEGYHTLIFDASGLSSGIYFVHANVPGQLNEMRKVILIK